MVEFYKKENEQLIFLDRKKLVGFKDAFYRFGDKKHNLFLKDVNGDQSPEIIVPTIDKNLQARLNVFIFDFENETLHRVSKSQLDTNN